MFLINPYIADSLSWLADNLAFSFFIGFFFGIIIIDVAYSTQLIVKVRKYAKENDLIVKYEEFKESIKEQTIKNKEKYSFLFAINNNVKSMEQHIKAYKKLQTKRNNEIRKSIHLFIRDKVKLTKIQKDNVEEEEKKI